MFGIKIKYGDQLGWLDITLYYPRSIILLKESKCLLIKLS